jgi:3-phenylpropionate/trans-cinnamate dioxygenase ferredoxin subunit
MSVRIGSSDDFPEGKAVRILVDETPLAVVRIGAQLYAVGDVCSHANYSLSEGEVYAEELEIECWKHGSTFSLETGKPTCLPATRAVAVYDVHEADGQVYLEEKK